MIRKLFITSTVLLVLGNIGRIYANNYTYIDENNILRDTAWMPISALMLLGGALLLLITLALYGVNYLKSG